VKEERIWAAGFFDGEGWTGPHLDTPRKDGTRRRSVRMSVAQKDKRPLERFHRAVGGTGRIYRKGSGMSEWKIAGQSDVHLVIWLLWPFLSEPKREQIARNC